MVRLQDLVQRNLESQLYTTWMLEYLQKNERKDSLFDLWCFSTLVTVKMDLSEGY